jgi:hypothetical protein
MVVVPFVELRMHHISMVWDIKMVVVMLEKAKGWER